MSSAERLGGLAVSATEPQAASQRLEKHSVILLTGFEPFGGATVNSSWEAVARLEGMMVRGAMARTVKLPVLWDAAGQILHRYVDAYDPMLVVSVGQGGPQVALEQYARNWNDAVPDNAGALAPKSWIVDDGPERVETSVNVEAVSQSLQERRFRHVISADAGGYLCNFVAYHEYHDLQKRMSSVPAIFVHVPPISSRAEAQQIITLSKMIEVVAEESARQLDDSERRKR